MASLLEGYTYDREARRRRVYGFPAIVFGPAAVAALVLALVTAFAGRNDRALVAAAAFVVFVGAGLLFQTKPRCSQCGKRMSPMHMDVRSADRSWDDGLLAAGESDDEVLYVHGDDGMPDRAMKRAYACHHCKLYFVEMKVDRSVDGGWSGVERQKAFRRKKRRMKRDGGFDGPRGSGQAAAEQPDE